MPPDVAAGAFVADDAELGDGVIIEPGAMVHPGVRLGRDCLIEAGAVVGKQPRLRRGSSAAAGQPLAELVLGDGVKICAGAVVYAGTRIGDGSIIGDQAQVRERVSIGSGCVVGRGSTVDFDTTVGDRVLIQTLVYLTAGAVVEDDVFIGPGAVTTNDHTMGRHAAGEPLAGPTLRRACRVGGGVVLVPGVKIGEEAFVAAGAVVVGDVGPREVVMGVPARAVRTVPDEDLIERWRD